MPLRITYEPTSQLPLDFTGIIPDWTRDKSRSEIERLQLLRGRQQVALGDICGVDGDPSDGRIELKGDFSSVHGIGTRMGSGEILIRGNAGTYLGFAMRGGEIHLAGSARDFVGAEMQGGMIRVDDSAGDHVGGARSGSPRGMSGGAILISGDVGDDVGLRMRRGIIAVAGSAGACIGRDMLAGTIVVGGSCGESPGCGMKRGTLCLLSKLPRLLPTFRLGCVAHFPVLQLIDRQLCSWRFPITAVDFRQVFRIWHGDALTLGKGEVFVPECA